MKIMLYTCAAYDIGADTTNLWSKVYSHQTEAHHSWRSEVVRDIHRELVWTSPETYVRAEALKAAQRWADMVDALRNPF